MLGIGWWPNLNQWGRRKYLLGAFFFFFWSFLFAFWVNKKAHRLAAADSHFENTRGVFCEVDILQGRLWKWKETGSLVKSLSSWIKEHLKPDSLSLQLYEWMHLFYCLCCWSSIFLWLATESILIQVLLLQHAKWLTHSKMMLIIGLEKNTQVTRFFSCEHLSFETELRSYFWNNKVEL